ncbi:MAG: hypothetical protein RPU64_15860, partial [Candidatus Sedimenticola sp. (ex Thyasira tokunagai)]
CSAAASFSVPILSALLDNPFIALYAHSHWLLKSHPTGWTTILTEGGKIKHLRFGVGVFFALKNWTSTEWISLN